MLLELRSYIFLAQYRTCLSCDWLVCVINDGARDAPFHRRAADSPSWPPAAQYLDGEYH